MYSALDLRMTGTSGDFVWAEERHRRVPIVRYPGGGIIQPLVFYFGHLARTNRESIKSLWSRAYAIRPYFASLESQGVNWRRGGRNRYLSRHRQALKDAGEMSAAQIEENLQKIFDFYLTIPDAMPYGEDGTVVGEFVGDVPRKFPITSKTVTIEGEKRLVWIGHKVVKADPPKPSVLDAEEIGLVREKLRDVPANDNATQGWVDPKLKGDRDWAMGGCMSLGGLRSEETAELALSAITESLRNEGVLNGLPDKYRKMKSIADLSGDKDGQELVLNALKKFEQRKRRNYLYVGIDGKGDKPRQAAFKVELMRDLLIVAIWGVRAKQLAEWRKQGLFPTDLDRVFLSFSTRAALKAGSVSDILKQAFERARIEGSAHDFRKFYATEMASGILRRVVGNLGYLTHAVMHSVYHQVADALGHAKITTTTRHYVDVAVIAFTAIESRVQRRKLLAIWEALLEEQDNLDPERIRLVGTSVKLLASLPKASPLYAILEGALTDIELNPDGMIKFAKPKPNLKLVVSNTDAAT